MKQNTELLALAYYEVSLETGQLRANFDELNAFYRWQSEGEAVSLFLRTQSNGSISRHLESVFSPMFIRFLDVVIQEGCLLQFGRIIQELRHLCIQNNKLIRLRIETAEPLSTAAQERILESIQLSDDQWLDVSFEIEKSLIYGIRVFLNQAIYDMSARAVFNQLEERITV